MQTLGLFGAPADKYWWSYSRATTPKKWDASLGLAQPPPPATTLEPQGVQALTPFQINILL